MPEKALAGFVMAIALSALSLAQTKISGTVKCAKPDQTQKIDVGDRPNHSFVISQGKCTWTKPMTLADTQTKSDVGTNFEETTSTGANVHSFVVGTLENGDKFTVQTSGKDVYKGGNLESSDGTWSFNSGTGKIKGIRGKGTFKGKPDPDGSVVVDVEGEYSLPK
jgi:hypothetical protein